MSECVNVIVFLFVLVFVYRPVQVRPHPMKAQETELVGILTAESGSSENESAPEEQLVREVRLSEPSKVRCIGCPLPRHTASSG